MSICIKFAEATSETDDLFRMRHRVFVEEEGYLSARPDGRIFDRFDAFPTTGNTIAVADGRVIGGVRFVDQSVVGTPADDVFDFSPFINGAVKVGGAGMFCLERAYRHNPRLTFSIMAMGFYWAKSRGLSHILSVVNPKVEVLLQKSGFRSVGPQMYDEKNNLPFVPMVLVLKELSARFLSFLQRLETCASSLHQTVLSPGSGITFSAAGRYGHFRATTIQQSRII